MNKLEQFFNWAAKSVAKKEPENETLEPEKEAFFLPDRTNRGYGNYQSYSFDGAKNLGEAGPIIDWRLNKDGLRLRSWQSYIESEVTQTVITKLLTWVITGGLKLTSEPAKGVLESEGIKIDTLEFSKQAEQRFNLFRESEDSDYAGMTNLDTIANEAVLNAFVGGDCLVILRYDKVKGVNIQLLDGAHIRTPVTVAYSIQDSGICIRDGIEMDARGKHLAYWIVNEKNEPERIEAFGKKSGLRTAFLFKMNGYRLDEHRGMPLISVVLEKLKKMERYESATLASAEERAKIAYFIHNTKESTGESVLAGAYANATAFDDRDDVPTLDDGTILAKTIAVSTNKQVFNMPLDSELKALESDVELNYKDFYTTNIIAVCAAINMPYQVAFSLYEGNYSASRAALKDWENTIKILRKKIQVGFYQHIYNFWLEVEILNNKVDAPGYFMARMNGNSMIINAYRKARFVGVSVPHIDPLKEVAAMRLALGNNSDGMPLITLENATELLNQSESHENMLRFSEELKDAEKLGIKTSPPQPTSSVQVVNNNAPKKKKPIKKP